ncbi:MAG: acyltransferase [Bacteroidetes bacterium]|nr:acyltransferase [Bacteroidota bacterium]
MEAAPLRHSGNNFDFIRFIAASLVIITHSQALLGQGDCDLLCRITGGTVMFSHLAVAIFFTISGYLIAQSLASSKSYRSYLWKRLLRIMPGLITVMVLIVFVLGPIVTTVPLREYFSSGKIWSVLGSISMYRLDLHLPGVFTHNFESAVDGSLWTLSYEFTFYLLLLVAFSVGIFRQRMVLLIGWALLFALRAYLGNKIYFYDKCYSFLLNHNIEYLVEWALYFGAGTITFLYKDVVKFNVWIFLATVVLLCGAIFIGAPMGRLACYLCIPYIIFYLGFLPGPLHQFGRYGDFSYGIYIYAFPVQQTIIHYAHGRLGVGSLMILSFVCTLPLAALSWHLVEKRALQFKNYVQ